MFCISRAEDANLALEPIQLVDVGNKYLSWLKNPDVVRHLANPLSLQATTLDDLKSYVLEKMESRDVWFWKIEKKPDRTHIGNVKLEPIVWQERYAVFGILLGESIEWGKGYGRSATILACNAIFETNEIDTVYLGVEKANSAAIRLYERIGFKVVSGIPNSPAISPSGIYMALNKTGFPFNPQAL